MASTLLQYRQSLARALDDIEVYLDEARDEPHAVLHHLRQQGMMLAFDVAGAPPGFARRFFAEALARELLLRPIGNTVYTMPPYILSGAEIAHLANQTAAALEASLG